MPLSRRPFRAPALALLLILAAGAVPTFAADPGQADIDAIRRDIEANG